MERRKPLKRTGGPTRKSGLSRATKPMNRGKPLAPRSPKRAVHMATERRPAVEAAITAGRTCEVCPVLERLGIETHCQQQIGGIHERRKSGAGGSRVNPDNLIPACNWGNERIESVVDVTEPSPENPLGGERWRVEHSELVVREGHPDWDRLSKRHDR